MNMDYEDMNLRELVDDLLDEVNSDYFDFRNILEESDRLTPLLETLVDRYTETFPEFFPEKSKKRKKNRKQQAIVMEQKQSQKADRPFLEHDVLKVFIRKYYGSDAGHVEFLGRNGVEVTSKKGEISTFVLIGDRKVRSGTGKVIPF